MNTGNELFYIFLGFAVLGITGLIAIVLVDTEFDNIESDVYHSIDKNMTGTQKEEIIRERCYNSSALINQKMCVVILGEKYGVKT